MSLYLFVQVYKQTYNKYADCTCVDNYFTDICFVKKWVLVVTHKQNIKKEILMKILNEWLKYAFIYIAYVYIFTWFGLVNVVKKGVSKSCKCIFLLVAIYFLCIYISNITEILLKID